jgi:hypothetical protein
VVTAATAAACLAALVVIFLQGRRWGRGTHWLAIGLLVAMPLGLLTSLHCHDYDLVLMIPSLVAYLKSGSTAMTPRWLLVPTVVLVPAFLLPFYADIHYGYLLKGGLINPLFVGLVLYSAVGIQAAARLAAQEKG